MKRTINAIKIYCFLNKSLNPVDYNTYRKFWALQDAFSKPNFLYDKMIWKQFTNVNFFENDVILSYCLKTIL